MESYAPSRCQGIGEGEGENGVIVHNEIVMWTSNHSNRNMNWSGHHLLFDS